MMSYSAISAESAKVAVPSSRKKKTAVTEEEPLPFTDENTNDEIQTYGEDETY